MNTIKAHTLGQRLIQLHLGSDWCLMWDKHQERLGSTQPTRKIITLNKAAVALNCPRVILDALYHEIAHAKVGTQHGHDEVWQELCLSLGGNGQPFIDRTVIKMP